MAPSTIDPVDPFRKEDPSSTDLDFLRNTLARTLALLMDAEVANQVVAEHGVRTLTHTTHRNGHRSREWDTRVGTPRGSCG